nr:MAG TPA: hypothetical protein [Caudoviricetes sp.]
MKERFARKIGRGGINEKSYYIYGSGLWLLWRYYKQRLS